MISIDTVYQRVLAISNKEQRGHITPLEFNLLANQAQMIIFEQYFYDLDQAKRNALTDESTFSDMPELIKNKLTPFTRVDAISANLFPNNYRTGRIMVGSTAQKSDLLVARKVDIQESIFLRSSQYHKKGLENNPIYVELSGNLGDVIVFDHTGEVTGLVEYTVKPKEVMWGYDVIAGKALYNASHSVDFELHESEQTELVYKILTIAGLTIKSQDLIAVGGSLDNQKIQQEKL